MRNMFKEESNVSHFVTKVRWAVESIHGVYKQKYHLLDHKIDNKLIPKSRIYFRIASFLNKTQQAPRFVRGERSHTQKAPK